MLIFLGRNFFEDCRQTTHQRSKAGPRIAEDFRGSPDVLNKLAMRSTAIYLTIAVFNQKALDRSAIAHI